MTQEELLRVIEMAASEGAMELDLSGKDLTVLPPEIGKLTHLKKLILGKYEYDDESGIVDTIGNNLSALPPEIGQLDHLEELQVVGNRLSSLPAEIGKITNLQTLHLSSNQLSVLPAEIGKITNLQTLHLSSNQLSVLPAEIGKLTNLQTLDLSFNQLSTLPAEIGQLTNLQTFNPSSNQLSALPAEIGKLTNLQTLKLNNNQLSALPAEIGQLTNLQLLHLMSNKLSALPAEIVQLTNLESLYLCWNQLSALPAEIVQLTNLQLLDLRFNQLSALPAEIVQLTNLQSLSFSENRLSALPAEIFQLTNLQRLDLSENRLSALPAEIIQLTNLQTLSLCDNRLSTLPAEIVQLTNLQSLYLHSNQLSTLPAKFGQLTNLQTLDLRWNQLSALPAEIGKLTNLLTLKLSSNQLSALPAEIGKLTNLQTLELSSNQLSALPAEIGKLTNLQSLHLDRNQFSTLPAEFGQLTNLQSLYLSSNQFSTLPAEFGQLTNLQTLYLDRNQLSNNQLSALAAEFGQLTNLQTLYLSDNQLSALPQEIVQLTNLQSLYLWNNQLSTLPAEIGQLTNLQSLSLGRNQLSALPAEFGQLTKLQMLDLRYNQLSALPAEFGQLTNLQTLSLNRNQLSALPQEFRQLTKLELLDLRGNPVPILPEILGSKDLSKNPGDVNEILDFYFRVQDPNETEPLYEAKFLIVGEGGAGKTSLAKKIADETYKLQSDEESTQGIDVIQWNFTQPNGQLFRVNIWDFGGQVIYHQTHQFFLTKRSLYVLVADTRKENTDFDWWLKVVELLSDNSPVLIIKNEKQDRQCEVNERRLRGEFTNLKEILATNLATNRGLPEIKNAIENYISRLPHVGTPLPKLWVRVRSALENYSRNYISLEEYCTLCRENKLTDDKDMLRLIHYLHDLGVCLHFQDDSTLKHYVILKPEWGTTAVYKVLDNDTVKKKLGCFTQDNLADIWKDGEYAQMRDELLQLMMRFKLCYQIPSRPGTYIAPQLLSVNQPDYTWDDSNNLILRYEYDFMPKGILTRFIVETHFWIEQQKLVWRSGVVLDKDQTRAEVIENYNQKQIKIRVAGNRKKELLAVVTHELEKIHKSFERLQYQTLVPCNCSSCQGSQTPYSYLLDVLHRFLDARQNQIQCQKSFQMVDVRKLIDDVMQQTSGAELQRELEQKKNESQQSFMPEPIIRNQVFISYSHQDQQWFTILQKHLKPIIRNKKLTVWDDTKIQAGAEWRQEIEEAIAAAKVAVLMVSPDFLASDFIADNELPPLLNTAQAKGLTIIWIPLRFSSYKETAIEKYQAAHDPKNPLSRLSEAEQDGAWVDICSKIKEAAFKINQV
ncbi:GTPase [Brasilonema sennae CENA114]|uniref:non-specific serine/threonine protein kinase n=1 Tax=Brasilonema sennae CENA114 TaxID=415709 RepID=A0A856MIT5_9CYAN|nr:leucine-rich repeat domain-containing protein [Brasilonema sennae]QDL11275.1 GTPase [Brasilonema sennae CENA114]